ncbi:YbjN domain-containing protein [uncultured Tessaracoccus sp.]|uniref:YbjN domain-containing protein n=1 Tax=uncultured Tessaracoccus sp. TaxID=905023 RepID=UPI0025E23681|nr:YbjN domain-containing protein [uncultured Tessaracoccus sp.]
MPLFGDTDDQSEIDAATLGPVTIQRIATTLDALEVNYGTDEDGDLIAGFGGNPCWFGVAGPGDQDIAFSFSARWRGSLEGDRIGDALATVNEWNASQMFPRAMCVSDEEDRLVFGADYIHDHEFGVTDLQLRNDVSIAITTAVNYFAFLDDRFPTSTGDDADVDDDPSAEERPEETTEPR